MRGYWSEKIQQLKKDLKKITDDQEENYRQRQIQWMEATLTAVIVSEEQGEIDKFQKHGLDITSHRSVIKNGFELADGTRISPENAFKQADHPFRIAIVCAMWLTGFDAPCMHTMYVDKPMKSIFATNYPNYKAFRRTNERVVYLDSLVLHESVSRSEEELRYKLKNWSHNTHVNDSFMDKWLKVNETNYKDFQDFYYIEPDRWKTLDYFPTRNIEEVKKYTSASKKLQLGKSYLFFKNFGQWFKFLFK